MSDCLTAAADLGTDEDKEEPVPLPNVNAAILKKVIQWCTYHKDDPPPPEDDKNKEKRTDDICSWDKKFLNVDQGTLFELILVSFLYVCLIMMTLTLATFPFKFNAIFPMKDFDSQHVPTYGFH